MAWTFYGTTAGCVLSETTAGNSKTLTVADLPKSYDGFTEIKITSLRIELVTSGVPGNRSPVIQILGDDGTEDVLMQIPLKAAVTATTTISFEVYCGDVASTASSTEPWSATAVAINSPIIRITPGVKLRVVSTANGDVGDSYVVHVRGEAI